MRGPHRAPFYPPPGFSTEHKDSSPSCTQPGPRHLTSSPASSFRALLAWMTPLQVPRLPLLGPSPALTLARDGGAGPAAVRGRRWWQGTRWWRGDAVVALTAVDPAAPTSRREPPAAAFMVRRPEGVGRPEGAPRLPAPGLEPSPAPCPPPARHCLTAHGGKPVPVPNPALLPAGGIRAIPDSPYLP